MADWDWGTVPTWLSALLTGGSLLLGFYILLRDRKKEERNEAAKVTCWINHEGNSTADPVIVSLLNTGDRPIATARVLTRIRGDRPLHRQYRFGDRDGLVLPGEQVTLRMEKHDQDGWPIAILFTDADGRGWARSLATGELARHVGAYYRASLYYRLGLPGRKNRRDPELSLKRDLRRSA